MKIVSVLSDYFGERHLKQLKLLDIGSSTGYITHVLSNYFETTIGIDIDEKGVEYSRKTFKKEGLIFYVQDSMDIKFPDQSFDVVNCSHIYEHVPDSSKLMAEIYRVLKHNGVCLFIAGNRINIIEPHYKLPFLSIVPKAVGHKYIRLFKKAAFYYETHLTYWGLKKLVSKFETKDYTLSIIQDPERFYATEMIKPGSLKQKIYLIILKHFYWVCPTYVWLLKKT